MFSAAEMTELRADQVSAMPYSCVVSNPAVEVDDAAGGTTPGTATTVTVACRIGSPRASDQTIADRNGIVVDAVLTLPFGSVVSNRATISCATNGKTYEVTNVNDEQTDQTAVRVFARSVRSEV